MYAGSFLHADDICTLAANVPTLEAQISVVKGSLKIKLNVSNCEIVELKKSLLMEKPLMSVKVPFL